jgi:rubrerythrin
MRLSTLSEVRRFAEKIEGEAVEFYGNLAKNEKEASLRALFQSFAKENSASIKLLNRVFQESITDAFETSVSFDLNPDDYLIDPALQESTTSDKTLNKAIEFEMKVCTFYQDAEKQSSYMFPDISLALRRTARKKAERQSKLSNHLKELEEA